MQRARAVLLAGLCVGAVVVVGVGFARAIDLGPGAAPVSTTGDHNRHRGGGAAADGEKPAAAPAGEHGGGHREEGPTPTAALDNGRYALELDRLVVPVGTRRLGFTITDVRTGEPVTRYDDDLTKKLHLIVIRQDLTGFQHVHPTLGPDGRWTVDEAVFDRAGPWRLIADFIPAGAKRAVLTSTVQASAGAFRARALRDSPRAGSNAWRTRVAGYDVTLRAGTFVGGREGSLHYEISRGGRPVAGLQPYLGALGHTVILRAGDLGYTHVHPRTGRLPTGTVEFDVHWPRAAPLAVFFQFRHRGVVRTAELHLPAPPAPSETP